MVRLLPRVWLVSIRFEVRGGSRHKFARMSGVMFVSIRFEVRGGSRRTRSTGGSGRSKFQSALRFAVVPDFLTPIGVTVPIIVSIRFEVRGGSRRYYPVPQQGLILAFQSALRFAVVPDKESVEAEVPAREASFNPL